MSFRTTFLRANYKEKQEVKRKKTDSTTDNLPSRTITDGYGRLRTIGFRKKKRFFFTLLTIKNHQKESC
ncbi:MAG TPA: hypothetical protein VK021_13205 [Flavobacteriaceae bacterium]|nr:hypothetical protein [Flavobacteriaceae bacterium]